MKYNISPIDTYIEKTCINIVERMLKDPNHPLTQAKDQLPKPHHTSDHTSDSAKPKQ